MYARVCALITFKLKEIIRLIRAWAYRVYMESIDLGLGQCMINVYVYPFMRACVRVCVCACILYLCVYLYRNNQKILQCQPLEKCLHMHVWRTPTQSRNKFRYKRTIWVRSKMWACFACWLIKHNRKQQFVQIRWSILHTHLSVCNRKSTRGFWITNAENMYVCCTAHFYYPRFGTGLRENWIAGERMGLTVGRCSFMYWPLNVVVLAWSLHSLYIFWQFCAWFIVLVTHWLQGDWNSAV